MSKDKGLLIGGVLLALSICTVVLFPPIFQRGAARSDADRSSSARDKSAPIDTPQLADDSEYCLLNGDEIFISVLGEGNLSIGQRIDTQGSIHWPLVGDVKVGGRTVRNTEAYLEEILIDKRMFKEPTVKVVVRAFAPKVVVLLGAVKGGGRFSFPEGKESIEILDLISFGGGLRQTAKSSKVQVTRADGRGGERKEFVDVESMMNGSKGALKSFPIYPGDKIYVAERLY